MAQLVYDPRTSTVTTDSLNEVYEELRINEVAVSHEYFYPHDLNVIYAALGRPDLRAVPGEWVVPHVDRINDLLFQGVTPVTPAGDATE